MKLDNRREWSKNEYICELTKELDSLSMLSESEHYKFFYHYVLIDNVCKEEKCLAIRVPGGTVGNILIDENNVIKRIYIDTDYVIDTYPHDVNEQVKKFIGEVIEY